MLWHIEISRRHSKFSQKTIKQLHVTMGIEGPTINLPVPGSWGQDFQAPALPASPLALLASLLASLLVSLLPAWHPRLGMQGTARPCPRKSGLVLAAAGWGNAKSSTKLVPFPGSENVHPWVPHNSLNPLLRIPIQDSFHRRSNAFWRSADKDMNRHLAEHGN